MSTVEDTELFDSSEYKIPYPTRDGLEVAKITERYSGSFERDRNNRDDAERAGSAQIGQLRRATIIYSLSGRANSAIDDGSVSETLVWRIHSVEDE